MLKDALQTIWMAPIRGITDLVYRNSFAELYEGIDTALVPFIQTVKGNQIKPAHQHENDPSQNRLSIVPQIIGKNPDHFIDLAKQLEQIGHSSVNWNLGCPYPTMTQKQCGSGLLPFPDKIDRFLDRVYNHMSLHLSIKMRLGLNSPTEISTLIPILNRYPLKHVTIHPRVGTQGYSGDVDLDTFQTCCDMITHPVIYNGDIMNLSDWQMLVTRFPQINTWMLGRGLMANPCLAEEIRSGAELPLSDKTKRIRQLHDLLLQGYLERLSGPAHQIQRLIGHWMYWQETFPWATKLIKKLKHVKTMSQYQHAVSHAFIEQASSDRA